MKQFRTLFIEQVRNFAKDEVSFAIGLQKIESFMLFLFKKAKKEGIESVHGVMPEECATQECDDSSIDYCMGYNDALDDIDACKAKLLQDLGSVDIP
jgi:hypothetical protein